MNRLLLILSSLFFCCTVVPCYGQQAKHTFTLGDSDFLLDGKPLQMISGEMHHARIPREAWRDRMKMAKAMGLNTIGTYVFWNVHEELPGTYDFSGNNDIAAFVKTAREEGLWVVLRPSPYVCAEWEFGGYPWWLLKNPQMKVRSTDPAFVTAYTRYINALAKELVPLQVTHGGNILMVQIENEYGSYSDDKTYLDLNRKIFREAGFDGILFTCDGADQMPKGYLPGYLPAVNGLEDPAKVKALINRYHNGKGPYYVAEWYPGWFDDWGKKHADVSAEQSAKTLDALLSAGISVNMYMFHGGTTRGFMNGANMNAQNPYSPQVSSYDYDAPLDEAGNPTEKFFAFRNVIKKYLPKGQIIPDVPAKKPAIKIADIRLDAYAGIFSQLPQPKQSMKPLSFEDLDQAYGFVLYRATLNKGGLLKIRELRDYALVYVNGKYITTLDRRLKQDSVALSGIPSGATLDLWVENNGRINYGPYLADNRHGITESVSVEGEEIPGWKMYRFPFHTVNNFSFSRTADQKDRQPVLYKGTFSLNQPADTYLDMRDFGKGFVFLNRHNLGKYWQIGPQQTIYVPASWLKKGKNEIVVFDELKSGHTHLTTTDHPILDQNITPEREQMKKWIFLSGLMAGMVPCLAQKAPEPYGALPTQAQLDWHEMEMYCIIHYGVDTYTDREWGYGDEDPALINPARFDAHQIVAAAKAGGFKGVVVVAKHHDGLCLWPTETTAHSIRKSPWKNGKGDMIQEYREACNRLDMKLGLYCSPWDRNNAYYGKPEYVDLYRRQLKELYANYGKLFISWHDGANGGDGYYGGSRETRKIDRSSYYGWETTWALTRSMQPGATIFGDVGPDVRWVGNEEGHAGETCWATYEPQAPEQGRLPSNGFTKYELGTEGTRNGKYWMPAECDVSLRPGWFYHARENSRVKTPDELLDLYYKSVGRGANLDLGLSPNPDGQLDPEDVASLQQFGYLIRQTFSKNLAAGASLSASNTRGNHLALYGPENLLDDDRYSYWATDDRVTTPELTLTLPAATTFNVIRLRENIRLGQRIEAFTIEAFSGGKWEKITAATSIGPNRLIRLQHPVTASRIRLTITQSPVAVALSDFGLYYEPELLTKPVITRSPEGEISITSSPKGSKIYYTLDGSTPTPSSSPYRKPFRLPEGGLVKALAVKEGQQSQTASLQSGPVKIAWKIVQPKYPDTRNPAEYAIDDRPETYYQASSMPSEMVIDMGRKQNIKAFTYLPRQDGHESGTITHYRIETSEDGVQWQKTADGEFSNIKANPVEQVVTFQKPVSVRFIRFKAIEILSGSGMTAAEIGVWLK